MLNNIEIDNKIGFRVSINNNSQTGITLSFSQSLADGWEEKHAVSIDNSNKIERILSKELNFKEGVSKKEYFQRLLVNIQSKEEQTRIFASEILCDFLEFHIDEFDVEILINGLKTSIEQLKLENNFDVEQKLAEGIFEFIWSEKMTDEVKRDFLIQLTTTNSVQVRKYLDDEEYLKIPEVSNYIKN